MLSPSASAPRHALMGEDLGVVNPLDFASAFTEATINMALAAQDADPITLLLPCGTWTLASPVVIPATVRLWVPFCTTVALNAGVTLTLNSPPLVEQAAWYTGPGTVVSNYTLSTSIGAAGNLQAADGLGGLAAYSGSGLCESGLFMTALLPTGSAICGTPVTPSTTGHILTDRAEPLLPQAVNLADKGTGVLQSTVSAGIASVTTLPVPAGGFAGLSGPQTLLNTALPLRSVALSTTTTPLIINLSLMDLASVNDLQQDTLFEVDPSGTGSDWQRLWLSLHSTIPRLLTWSEDWSDSLGIPLPTTTTGGGTFDLLGFMYNPVLGKLVLLANSQLLRPLAATGVVAGAYTCPATLEVNAQGQLTSLTSGTCGSGGGALAGGTGDIQLAGSGADPGTFSHDAASHITYTQGLQAGAGSGYQAFTDVRGWTGWLFPADLTASRVWKLPDTSGTVALLSDIAAGTVSATGTPAAGQLATWTNATTLQGVTTLPTAAFPALTGDVTTSAGSVASVIAAQVITSPKLAVANTLRTCTLFAGSDNGAVLVDADLGPQLDQCLVPAASTITEIVVTADAGTPNVLVHRRNGTTNTALLSSALATASSGGIACSKTSGVAGGTGVTCSATLQNTAVGAFDRLGLTSGTAGGVAKRLSVMIVMTVN